MQCGAGDGRFGQRVGHEGSGSFGPRRSACARRAAGRDGRARTGAGAASWITGVSGTRSAPAACSSTPAGSAWQRLQRLERAPELGHGGAAVAHEGLEAAGAVAVRGSRRAPCRRRRSPSAAPRTARPPCDLPGPAARRRPRPGAPARPAARRSCGWLRHGHWTRQRPRAGDCPVGLGSGGPNPAATWQSIIRHGGFLWSAVGSWEEVSAPGAGSPTSGSLADSRNFVHTCRGKGSPAGLVRGLKALARAWRWQRMLDESV